ncbi:RHO GDP-DISSOCIATION INHIBITOR 1-LIKE [Salix purpurea]|uniref:RHO GDP-DISSOCIATION INHIBITOR 1-LIKE n=1 Tax=Salix purpurea TaxID=77065 RepID=A0A9Q0PFG7_SALPP|nr:RHO GDP-DISSOCIATION INHIBITOR 1-LIKE [Salix purpurea]
MESGKKAEAGPSTTTREQIEKDKEDDSLRRWKEKLLGCVESDLNGQLEPEVKFHSIGIISDDIGEKNTPLPCGRGEYKLIKAKECWVLLLPQREPYVHTLEEDTAPSGVLARGTYSAKLKFEDDDRRCHMELKYSFEIKKRS